MFYSHDKHAFSRLFVLVLRQIKLVVASVRLGEAVSGLDLRDRELLTIQATEAFEPIDWYLAAAGDKLDEL